MGRSRGGLLKRFVVAETSMLPTLQPGDGLVGWRTNRVRRGELRVFEHPHQGGLWLVKRVGHITGTGAAARFEAVSDHHDAPGVVDSRRLGMISVDGSYRVLRTFASATKRPAEPVESDKVAADPSD